MNRLTGFESRPLAFHPTLEVSEAPLHVPSRRVVHTLDEIVRELAHGHIPVTDNMDALLALGFVRDRP